MKVKKKKNVSMKDFCSFKAGEKVRYMFFPKTEEELIEACDFCKRKKLQVFSLGNGSNLLFVHKFRGAVINMRAFDKIEICQQTLTCGGGVNLFSLNKFCAENGLQGLEFSYGIPASVGGAVKMNAGAFGGEICAFLRKMLVLKDGVIYEKDKFSYSYREGPLEEGEILISATFELKRGEKEEILAKQREFFEKRRQSQPYSLASAGSVFKRKGDVVPARLIDEWGLKGLKVGGAMISDKHAGFIVNLGEAKPGDILILIEIVEQVAKGHGLEFEREVKVI